MFLHSLYQRMLTGQVYVSSPDSALSRYSWTDMCNLISEQISAQLSELSRANERVGAISCDNSQYRHVYNSCKVHGLSQFLLLHAIFGSLGFTHQENDANLP